MSVSVSVGDSESESEYLLGQTDRHPVCTVQHDMICDVM